MNIKFKFKNLVVATAVVAMVVVTFLVHALAGLNAQPVVFADPPTFVERYAATMKHSVQSSPQKDLETHDAQVNASEPVKITTDFSSEAALMHKVFFDGESPAELLRLFTHPAKAQRVKMALAFAAVNSEFSHNEESGFPDKRREFWNEMVVETHVSDIQNALFEALITSAIEGTANKIPYTLAWWMPVRFDEKVEMLAWAAKHHPDPWVRRFCVYYVVKFGGNEEFAAQLLDSGVHDPAYKVRKTVLEQRFRRFIEEW